MRLIPLAVLAVLATQSYGQRLLNVPSAIGLLPKEASFETYFEWNGKREQETRIGVGLLPAIDAHLRFERFRPNSSQTTFDIGYSVARPIRGFGPGLGVGVLDLLGQTRDGTRGYVVLSHLEEGVDDVTSPISIETIVGFAFGRKVSLMGGTKFPLGAQLEFVGEHDGIRPSVGLKWKPFSGSQISVFLRENRTLLGLGFRKQF